MWEKLSVCEKQASSDRFSQAALRQSGAGPRPDDDCCHCWPDSRAHAGHDCLQPAVLSCEHARPTVEKAVAEAPAGTKVSRYDISSSEGVEYARAHGILSIPAVIVNCSPPLLLEDYENVDTYGRALREGIACEAGASARHGAQRRHRRHAFPHGRLELL
jgi:hypothetical protein